VTRILGTRIVAGLGTLFNFIALNLALLIASLPVITLPAAASAATAALDRWRADGEDRVVREFIVALRRLTRRTTLEAGVPFAAVALGVAEVDHFAHDRAPAAHLGLGLGLGALLITLSALGYVLLLAARSGPGQDTSARRAGELWSLCASLAVRNILVTGPLFLAEMAAATIAIITIPALALFGVPLLLLQLMRLTAERGLRRVNTSRSEEGKQTRGRRVA
jgi:hypothetical protein